MEKDRILLIVEDNSDMQQMLASIFTDAGLTVLSVSCGNEAINLTKQNPIKVVILDKRLPDLDGFQVFEQIKEINKETDIIILTAYGNKKIKEQAKQMGAFACRTKPFDNIELVNLVKRAINH